MFLSLLPNVLPNTITNSDIESNKIKLSIDKDTDIDKTLQLQTKKNLTKKEIKKIVKKLKKEGYQSPLGGFDLDSYNFDNGDYTFINVRSKTITGVNMVSQQLMKLHNINTHSRDTKIIKLHTNSGGYVDGVIIISNSITLDF